MLHGSVVSSASVPADPRRTRGASLPVPGLLGLLILTLGLAATLVGPAVASDAAYEARTPERTAIYSFERDDRHLTPEQEQVLRADPAALAFWEAATPSYRKQVATWVTGAKREATRTSRLQQLVADSAAGRLVPPQRYGDPPAWLARAAQAAAEAAGQAGSGA